MTQSSMSALVPFKESGVACGQLVQTEKHRVGAIPRVQLAATHNATLRPTLPTCSYQCLKHSFQLGCNPDLAPASIYTWECSCI